MMNKLSQIPMLNRIGRSLVVIVLAVLLGNALGASAVKTVDAAQPEPIASVIGAGQTDAIVAAAQELPAAPEVTLAAVPVPVLRHLADEQPNLLLEADVLAAAATPASLTSNKQTRVLWMEVTAYCACKKCCGPKAQGLTASGKRVSHDRGRFVAADTKVLPFGTKLKIPGYHNARPVEVIDRGGAIKGHKLDVFFPSHQVATEWGRRWIPVTVVE